jgi:hypothetical protein
VEVWNRAVTARTMLLVSGLAIAVVIAAGCLAYASGYEAGKDKALNLMAVVPAAMIHSAAVQGAPGALSSIAELNAPFRQSCTRRLNSFRSNARAGRRAADAVAAACRHAASACRP